MGQRAAVMSEVILDAWDGPVTPIHALTEAETAPALEVDPFAAALAATGDFKGKAGQTLLVPGADGALDRVLYGLGDGTANGALRMLPAKLPAGVYRIAAAPEGLPADVIALAWALGSYRFDR